MPAHALRSRSGASRRVAGVSLVVLAVAVIAILRSGGTGGHSLRVAFQAAVQVVPGQQVRIAGRPVGEIESVTLDGGEAVLVLRIDDDAWPLGRGTVARLHFGQPASYASRYVELTPPSAAQPSLPDGGILTTADSITPVEFDQLNRIFGPRTRRNFQGLLSNASATLRDRGPDISRALRLGSGGLRSVAGFYGELGSDRDALRTLVTAGARTTSALRRRETALRGLITNAAGTFDELAAAAHALQSALDDLPEALRSGRRTLGRLDGSLVGLQGLVDDVRPGAVGLRRIAPTARRAVTTLNAVAPLATSTLLTGKRSAPAIRRFLTVGTPFIPQLASVLDRLAPMAGCVRPYGPEIAGLASVWSSVGANYDQYGHYARASVQSAPSVPIGTSMTSKQVIDLHAKGALTYAMPRPPGLNAGQPWFIPQCGITPNALDPGKDPEAGR